MAARRSGCRDFARSATAFARHAGRPYVLKLSSWNTLFCDIVTEAFPETNWVLSLRDPVEVGVSLLRQPPGWLSGTTEASRSLIEIIAPEDGPASPEERVARAYGAFCAAAARLDPDAADSLTTKRCRPPCGTWWPRTFRSRSTPGSEPESRRPRACTRRRRSEAAAEFVPDAATKQAAASLELRRAIDAFARPHLERLVRLHAG